MIKYILTTLSLLLVFGACSDDNKQIYDPNNVKPGQLAGIKASYVLDPAESGNVAETFKWSAMDMGYQAAVSYTLEMDIVGNNFANVQELATGNILTADITVAKLNAAMIKLQQIYGFDDATEQSVEFRVKGTITTISPLFQPIYTNVITSKVTPYSAEIEYPKVWVIGDYCGWDHANSQFLFAFAGGTTYEGWIFFDNKAANGFKVTGAAGWDNGNWGLNSQTPSAEANSITLWNDGGSGNISCYSKNYYKFSFDTSTEILTKLSSMNTLGIIGDGANGWGDNDDIPFVFDTQKQVFVATVVLKDGAIKFRGDHDWNGINLGQKAGAETGILANGGDNISVVAGTYKITLNLNNSAEMTYKIEK